MPPTSITVATAPMAKPRQTLFAPLLGNVVTAIARTAPTPKKANAPSGSEFPTTPRQAKDDADGITKRQQRQRLNRLFDQPKIADLAFGAQPRANGTPAHDRLRKKPKASPSARQRDSADRRRYLPQRHDVPSSPVNNFRSDEPLQDLRPP